MQTMDSMRKELGIGAKCCKQRMSSGFGAWWVGCDTADIVLYMTDTLTSTQRYSHHSRFRLYYHKTLPRAYVYQGREVLAQVVAG